MNHRLAKKTILLVCSVALVPSVSMGDVCGDIQTLVESSKTRFSSIRSSEITETSWQTTYGSTLNLGQGGACGIKISEVTNHEISAYSCIWEITDQQKLNSLYEDLSSQLRKCQISGISESEWWNEDSSEQRFINLGYKMDKSLRGSVEISAFLSSDLQEMELRVEAYFPR